MHVHSVSRWGGGAVPESGPSTALLHAGHWPRHGTSYLPAAALRTPFMPYKIGLLPRACVHIQNLMQEAQQAQALLSAGAGKAAAGGPVTSEGQGEGAPATQPPPEAAPEAGLGAAGPQEPADPFGLETLLQPAP